MKREYKTPKAVCVDFCYDEQIVAVSGDVAPLGDPPPQLGRCRQTSTTTCRAFWFVDQGEDCTYAPFSLRH